MLRAWMIEHRLNVHVLPQPTETTCGPTCLHGVYGFWGDELPLSRVVEETASLPGGGTLSVLLGDHALGRGYGATIYSCNVQVFDPTWFGLPHRAFIDKLQTQAGATGDEKLRSASLAYVDFLQRGGKLRFEDPSEALISDLLARDLPVLTGLSATWLYQTARERPDNEADDITGQPVGHFVVLAGYRPEVGQLLVADPMEPNPLSEARSYWLDVNRVVSAILLGIVTYDANLLIIEPKA